MRTRKQYSSFRRTTPMLSSPQISHSQAEAENGMVVAQHKLAAEVGLEVLKRGGNAVDAAVTTAFATGVVLPIWNGIGGGGVMVVHMDDGTGGAVDFGMQAPGLAHAEMYELEDTLDVQGPSRRFSWSKVKNNANVEGYTSIAIPGTLAGMAKALEKWGTIDLAQALAPAIKLAEEGFPLPKTEALAMADRFELLSRFETTAEVYLRNGAPLSPGAYFVQKEHTETLRRIARNGIDELYGGETGSLICDDIEKNGGYLRLSDLRQYEPIVHDHALTSEYRGLTVSGVPGPCGCTTAIEILNILGTLDIGSIKRDSAELVHILIEAVKLAGVDRFSFMGDPAIYGFPIDALANVDYGSERASAIDQSTASEFTAGDPWRYSNKPRPADFPNQAGSAPDDGTTHITTADSAGNMVSLTQTNLGFSGVINPGVGVMMNNAMGWSAPMPGTINSIAPHARALNNMTPLILSRDGRAVMAVGGSGGRRIWPAVVQTILNIVDFGMEPQEAFEYPRIHVESDDPVVDPRFGETIDHLRSLGHRVSLPPEEFVLWPFSEPNGIVRKSDKLVSGLTPQTKPTHAAGY